MKTRNSLFLLPVALFALAACGGSSDFSSKPSDDKAEGIALEDLPNEYARAYCGLVERCFGPVYRVFFSLEDCETLFSEQVRDTHLDALERAIDAGTVKYDGKKLADCLEVIETRECAEANERSIEACEAALTGTVEPGGDCTIDEECVGSRICETSAGCPGKCVERYTAGHECGDNDECDDGLVCSDATSRCVAPAAEGAACQGGVEPQCEGGLLCIGDDANAGRTGTCRPSDAIEERQEGEACSPGDGELCAPGLSCVLDSLALTFTCKKIAVSGGTCGIGFPEDCPSGQYCPITGEELVAGTFESRCATLPADGEPCATRPEGIGPTCEAYTRCDASTNRCLGLRSLGESCSSDDLCYSGYCENNGCAPRRVCE
jgi:hypothetical protein